MTIKVRQSGSTKTAVGMKIKHAGSVRRVSSVKVMDGGTLKVAAQFAPPLSVTASPTTVLGGAGSNYPAAAKTESTTVITSGGQAPFTYSWARLSGGIGNADQPSKATTTFTAVISPGSFDVTFRVTVTDAFGQTATADVLAKFVNYGGGF